MCDAGHRDQCSGRIGIGQVGEVQLDQVCPVTGANPAAGTMSFEGLTPECPSAGSKITGSDTVYYAPLLRPSGDKYVGTLVRCLTVAHEAEVEYRP